MSLSKKDLKDIKNKLEQSNPNLINSIKKRTTTIKNKDLDEKAVNRYKSPKRQIKWNFSVNDIVEVVNYSENDDIGLIVSDYIYHSSKVEKNNFFVLVNNTVGKYDGRYLRKL